MIRATLLVFAASVALASAAFAQTQAEPQPAPPLPAPNFATEEWPDAWFEIFRLAPGEHEGFVRRVALADEVGAAAGLPPTRLYFHESGGDWDVLVLKVGSDYELTPEQEAAMARRSEELGLPTGPAYFVDLRRAVAEHSDTHAVGPVSAAQWLARLDAWRATHPEASEPESRPRRRQ